MKTQFSKIVRRLQDIAYSGLYVGAGLSDERAGFCFWLNRNGHGSGFWDEFSAGDEPGYSLCQSLSAASKKAGSRDLYLGDDGKIYQS